MEQAAKYRPNQMLKCLHTWATDHPSRPVESVAWDESWNCYTYSFPFCMIRIEEYELEPTGEPDMTPEAWLAKYQARPNATTRAAMAETEQPDNLPAFSTFKDLAEPPTPGGTR